jgi:FkbM family methyltransferase
MASFAKLFGAGLAHGARGVTQLLGRRTGARAAAHAASTLVPIIGAETGRGLLRFRCGSARAAAMAADFLQHEPDTRRWMDEYLQAGDVLWDIGANIGAYALYATLTPNVRVFAFEPLASTFALLADNIALNGRTDRATPLCVALSNSNGLSPFYLASAEPGTAMHALGRPENVRGRFEPAGMRTVMSMRADNLAGQLGLSPPDHVKIDVDGHEPQVLEGMGELLGQVRTVWIETEGPADHAINALLEARGFEPGISYGGRNRLFVNRNRRR